MVKPSKYFSFSLFFSQITLMSSGGGDASGGVGGDHLPLFNFDIMRLKLSEKKISSDGGFGFDREVDG